jgi:hypothetical protein
LACWALLWRQTALGQVTVNIDASNVLAVMPDIGIG